MQVRRRSLTIECYYRMCSLTIECVLLLQVSMQVRRRTYINPTIRHAWPIIRVVFLIVFSFFQIFNVGMETGITPTIRHAWPINDVFLFFFHFFQNFNVGMETGITPTIRRHLPSTWMAGIWVRRNWYDMYDTLSEWGGTGMICMTLYS